MKKIFLLLVLILQLFAGCSSDDSETAASTDGLLLKKVVYTFANDTDTMVYSYFGTKLNTITFDNGRVTKYLYEGDKIKTITISENNEVVMTITHTYDAQGRIIKAKRLDLPDMESAMEYTYNADNTVSRNDYMIVAGMQQAGVQGKYFFGSNGEVSHFERYYGSEIYTTTYTYDNMKNPMLHVTGLNEMSINQFHFNQLTETVTNRAGELTSLGTYVFEYNNQGFPLKSQYHHSDGTNYKMDYFYE